MHKLNRPNPPSCLRQYNHHQNKWERVTSEHKSEIWVALEQMQGNRCAYCESKIKTTLLDSNSHIEHFRQRSRYIQGTYNWNNLFGSCNRNESCGRYKDKLPLYNHLDLIKMDIEDPENFFTFLSDGNIIPIKGLDPSDKHRAEETIRIFNLNGPLRQIRAKEIQGYLQTAEYFLELANEFDRSEWEPELVKELLTIVNLPFATAIKHIILYYLPKLQLHNPELPRQV
jgi:uncharacterized protein (TIGR02646 family)